MGGDGNGSNGADTEAAAVAAEGIGAPGPIGIGSVSVSSTDVSGGVEDATGGRGIFGATETTLEPKPKPPKVRRKRRWRSFFDEGPIVTSPSILAG